MPSNFLIIFSIVCCLTLVPSARAFGAGSIADFSYLNDKAFRHGDIEEVLETLLKTTAGASAGGFLGAAAGMLGGSGGKTFSKRDIKRVYFGNWLRDYSQAMDIAGLSKMTSQTILLVLSVLAFTTFGYATEEYLLTPEKLGVYLPVEHIDNPKGYGEKEGDPRQYHPWLRPPVHPAELEIDHRVGIKNYIATEGQFWDTSAANVRRNLGRAIELARQAQGREGPALFEAYRLLGSGLHTLEDLLAHSNWVELGLRKMGYSQVFAHVGDNVLVNSPYGPTPPLVTGTFGGADFTFSILSEGGDKLSQNSLNDLSHNMENSHGNSNDGSIDSIKALLDKLPSSQGNQGKVQKAEELKANAIHFDPNNYSTEETQRQIWEALSWRDGVMRDIESAIEGIPGLETLVDEITQAVTVYVYTLIEPYLTPILKDVTATISQGTKAVLDGDQAQYEVFDNPNASDPSHSMLSKDHFDNILNEPAGKIAKVVVEHTVKLVVAAWSDPYKDINATLNEIILAFHHPYFANLNIPLHRSMDETLKTWFVSMDGEKQAQTLERLTKDSVRKGLNKRIASPEEIEMAQNAGYGGQVPLDYGHGHNHGGYYEQPSAMGGYGSTGNPYGSTGIPYGSTGNSYDYQQGGYYEEHHSGGGGGAGMVASGLVGLAGGGIAGAVLSGDHMPSFDMPQEVEQFGENIEGNVGDVVDDFRDDVADVGDYVEDAAEDVGDYVEDAGEYVEDAAEEAVDEWE